MKNAVPVPPKSEQYLIVNELNKKISQFDAIETNVQSALAFLREKRKALISSVVTGKIDVRNFKEEVNE